MEIIENEECYSCREAAAILNCSIQTVWRYASTRIKSRKLRHYIENRRYFIPGDEIDRFRDEIRPTFLYGGKYGRPMGSKDKKPRKKRTDPNIDPEEIKLLKMTPVQRVNYIVRRANKMARLL